MRLLFLLLLFVFTYVAARCDNTNTEELSTRQLEDETSPPKIPLPLSAQSAPLGDDDKTADEPTVITSRSPTLTSPFPAGHSFTRKPTPLNTIFSQEIEPDFGSSNEESEMDNTGLPLFSRMVPNNAGCNNMNPAMIGDDDDVNTRKFNSQTAGSILASTKPDLFYNTNIGSSYPPNGDPLLSFGFRPSASFNSRIPILPSKNSLFVTPSMPWDSNFAPVTPPFKGMAPLLPPRLGGLQNNFLYPSKNYPSFKSNYIVRLIINFLLAIPRFIFYIMIFHFILYILGLSCSCKK